MDMSPVQDSISSLNINWPLTSSWFNRCDPLNPRYSSKSSQQKTFIIKNLLHTLPTEDILFRNLSQFYASQHLTSPPCFFCTSYISHSSMNAHLFTCNHFHGLIFSTMASCKHIITSFLIEHNFYPGCDSDIDRNLRRSHLFSLPDDGSFTQNHPFYLLLRGFVPQSLVIFLKSRGLRLKQITSLIFDILQHVQLTATQPIWNHYLEALLDWERQHHVSKYIKKLRRKRFQLLKKSFLAKSSRRLASSVSVNNNNRPSNNVTSNTQVPANSTNSALYSPTASVFNNNFIRLPDKFWVYCTSSYFRHGGNLFLQFFNSFNFSLSVTPA
jgi:hypothetical protein